MSQSGLSVLPAEDRKKLGSSESNRLRKAGRVPAVIYGHKEANVSVTVSKDDVNSLVRFNTRIIDVQLKGQQLQKCLIRDVQWDVYGKEVNHVDFERVSADERIHVSVPIKMKGSAPVAAGAVLDFHLHELEIECPAGSIPENILVVVGGMTVGQIIHVKELTLPEGVKALARPEEVVVSFIIPAVKAEAVAPAEGSVEPEVITARKPTEEEGDEKPKK